MLFYDRIDMAVITFKSVDCHIIHDISKPEAITLKFSTLRSWVFTKIYIKEIIIKSRVYNYYFDNLIKSKKLETKNILIN